MSKKPRGAVTLDADAHDALAEVVDALIHERLRDLDARVQLLEAGAAAETRVNAAVAKTMAHIDARRAEIDRLQARLDALAEASDPTTARRASARVRQ